jgi:hypothetical protein
VPSFRSGTVTAILRERAGLQRIDVDGEPAYVLTALIGTVEVGDRVVINTTAVDLGLGTGGWHVVHWNLEREDWSAPVGGREMKLRYTSLQLDVAVAAGGALPDVPTVGCTLHSQVAAVALAYRRGNPEGRVVYVMPDGGALPIALSDLVHTLRDGGYIDATVTAGHAFGGDAEATTLDHALRVAGEFAPDVVVVAIGPGSLGVGSEVAFSARDVVRALEVASDPILALRFSGADRRERHTGVSHHAAAVLDGVERRVVRVPIPRGEPAPDVARHRVVEVDVPDLIGPLTDLGVTSMGRSPAEDPKFWAYAGAAGVAAADRSS